MSRFLKLLSGMSKSMATHICVFGTCVSCCASIRKYAFRTVSHDRVSRDLETVYLVTCPAVQNVCMEFQVHDAVCQSYVVNSV